MKVILIMLALASCAAPRANQRSAMWTFSGTAGLATVGAVGGSIGAVIQCAYCDNAAVVVGGLSGVAIAGGIAGYFLGQCARDDEEGGACRVGVIIANSLLGATLTAVTTFAVVCRAGCGGG